MFYKIVMFLHIFFYTDYQVIQACYFLCDFYPYMYSSEIFHETVVRVEICLICKNVSNYAIVFFTNLVQSQT